MVAALPERVALAGAIAINYDVLFPKSDHAWPVGDGDHLTAIAKQAPDVPVIFHSVREGELMTLMRNPITQKFHYRWVAFIRKQSDWIPRIWLPRVRELLSASQPKSRSADPAGPGPDRSRARGPIAR